MGFIHGLALVLIIFEGIIIQCNGAGDVNSVDWIPDAPIIDIRGDKPLLPDHLFEVIIDKTNLATVQTAVQSRVINVTTTVMKGILRDRTVLIVPKTNTVATHELYKDDDLFLTFSSYQKLVSFFDEFGKQVRKIKIFYGLNTSSFPRGEINHKIIKKYANSFKDIRVKTYNDEKIWEEISNGENGIIFPKVENFQYSGKIDQNKFKLNLMFPKLKSFKLSETTTDMSCLANVMNLNELHLPKLTQEHQLGKIFANNKNMTKITLTEPVMAETMQSIARNLKKLETLEIIKPGKVFLFRTNNAGLYNLSSVKHLDIQLDNIKEINGDLSFDMPHLKRLSLGRMIIDDRAVDFIRNFEKLETVEFKRTLTVYEAVKLIVKLKHIKEFMLEIERNCKSEVIEYFPGGSKKDRLRVSYEDSLLQKLRKVFDEESNLQTLKLLDIDESKYQDYENTMKKINSSLAKSKKPTWKLSHVKQHGTCQNYLMFKREKC